jgi:hypothetical protein
MREDIGPMTHTHYSCKQLTTAAGVAARATQHHAKETEAHETCAYESLQGA